MNIKMILNSVAIVGVLIAAPAYAGTVTTETFVHAKDIPGARKVDFRVFDLNRDGILSMPEVGEELFYCFDQDGNKLIDNIEWKRKNVLTISPMEKETYRFVDFNDDGMADTSSYTYQDFYEASGLIRFDKNANGLSPEEFIGVPFNKLDTNSDHLISLDEWKQAYMAPRMKRPAHFNN